MPSRNKSHKGTGSSRTSPVIDAMLSLLAESGGSLPVADIEAKMGHLIPMGPIEKQRAQIKQTPAWRLGLPPEALLALDRQGYILRVVKGSPRFLVDLSTGAISLNVDHRPGFRVVTCSRCAQSVRSDLAIRKQVAYFNSKGLRVGSLDNELLCPDDFQREKEALGVRDISADRSQRATRASRVLWESIKAQAGATEHQQSVQEQETGEGE